MSILRVNGRAVRKGWKWLHWLITKPATNRVYFAGDPTTRTYEPSGEISDLIMGVRNVTILKIELKERLIAAFAARAGVNSPSFAAWVDEIQAAASRGKDVNPEHYLEMIDEAVNPHDSPCPKCGSFEIGLHHHDYDVTTPGSLPDCSYLECHDCHHQWNHS